MGEDVITDSQEHITQEALEKSSTQLVEKGTLLIVVKSKVLMKRLPIARTAIDCCFNQDIKAMVLKNPLITRYIHRHIKIGQTALLRLARGVNTEGLTLDHLRNYQVLMPPNEKILDFCKLDQANERVIQKLRHSLAESENLFNSLLQRAFTGNL
jgi:type I restriction enzyme S subunit